MSRSRSIGIAAVLAVVLGVVSWSLLRSPVSGMRIHLEESPPSNSALVRHAPRSVSVASPAVPASPARNIETPASAGDASAPIQIVVQVAGAVRRPGVYRLAADARNDDAVKAAGGLAANANEASVNLAAHAIDGSQIYIKNRKEQPEGGASEETITAPTSGDGKGSASQYLSSKLAHSPLAHPSVAASKGASTKPQKLKSPSEGKININTATAEELQRIPNIGPAMAQKVIAYREENHGFQSIEDLMQVSGIGEKKFSKIHCTVNGVKTVYLCDNTVPIAA